MTDRPYMADTYISNLVQRYDFFLTYANKKTYKKVYILSIYKYRIILHIHLNSAQKYHAVGSPWYACGLPSNPLITQ